MKPKHATIAAISILVALATIGSPPDALAGTVYRMDLSTQPDGPANLPGVVLTEGKYRLAGQWLTVDSDNSNPRVVLPAKLDGDGTVRGTVRAAALSHRVMIQGWGVYTLEVNRQFGQVALSRTVAGATRQVAKADRYLDYAKRLDRFELRLVRVGRKVAGFIDDCKLVEFDDPADVPTGGKFALLGGWGTQVAWRDVSVSDQSDLTDAPRETFPATAPADLVRVTRVRGLTPDNIYFDEEEDPAFKGFGPCIQVLQGPVPRFEVTVVSPTKAKVLLEYSVVDVNRVVIATGSTTVDLSNGREKSVSLEFTPKKRGCFKFVLYAGLPRPEPVGPEPPPPLWVEDIGCVTIVNKAVGERAASAPDSIFGGHIDGINLDWHATAARKLGVRWARCHDMLQYTWWTRVQPNRADEWKWADASQATVDKHGYATLGEFLWTPKWASTRPDDPRFNAYPPARMDDFANYVTATVGHYRGSIHTWEVWNEPHFSGFWAGSPAQYARLLETAYAAAKKADPKCVVLGGGGVSPEDMRWIEQFVASLHGKPMDAFSIHYPWPDAAKAHLDRLRSLLAKHDIDVPIWDTEASVITTSFLDQHRRATAMPEARFHYRNACYELVRMYMENLANGVQRVFYYEFADPWRMGQFPKPRPPKHEIASGMWDEGQQLKPIGAAHAALADVIEGKTFKKRITAGPAQVFIFASPEESTAVCYAEFDSFRKQARVPVTLPAGIDVAGLAMIDFMDNALPLKIRDNSFVLPLSREPVYLRLSGRDAADKLEAMLRLAVANVQ